MYKTTRQTFYTHKRLRDATGVQYFILISHGSNPITRAYSKDKLVILTANSVKTLRDGSVEHIYTYTGTGLVSIEFKHSTGTNQILNDIPASEQLSVPFDSLERSFQFDINRQAKLGYDITDALYYDSSTRYPETYVLPSSSEHHLDTSSKEDFYYLADGSSPYIASTDLQNKFLVSIGYEVRGFLKEELGRFRGGFDDGAGIFFTTTHTSPDTGTTGTSATVRGGIEILELIPRSSVGPNENRVCLDPTSSNYYLHNCTNEELPCIDAGGTFSDDCLGVALTADRINNFLNLDGGCCEYTTGCEDFEISLGVVGDAAVDTTNGTAQIIVTGGTANYTTVVNAISLQNPALSFSTQTTGSIATDVITLSSLFPGTYSVQVTDSTAGTNCTETLIFTVEQKGADATGEGTYGCKSTSSAINHDTTVTNHLDQLCVFCDAVSGKLFADSSNPDFLGDWVEGVPTEQGTFASTTTATSSPAGASLSDGTITFEGIVYPDAFTLSNEPYLHEFSVGEEFTSDQANSIDYQLYRFNDGYDVENLASVESDFGDAKTELTNNASAVGSVVQTNGSAHVFTALAAGSYAILVTYDADGTPNGSPEEEQCYRIFRTFTINQGGCTDPVLPNYNADAVFNDGTCRALPSSTTATCEDPALRFDPWFRCNSANGGISFLSAQYFTAANEENGLADAMDGFFMSMGGLLNIADTQGPIAQAAGYIFSELFCYTTYNYDNVNYIDIVNPDFVEGQHNTNGNQTGYAPQSTNSTGGLMMNSNGESSGNAGGPHVIVINITANFASGNTMNGDVTLYEMISGEVNLFGQLILPEVFAQHGPVVSIDFQYNFGTYGVWQQSAGYTHTFTQEEQDQQLACADVVYNVGGCTDPQANNYNPGATEDDGTCTYDPPPAVLGCTDPTASNYNPLANADDGSCQYIPEGSWVADNCFTCSFSNEIINGYATQEECEDNLDDNATDCCALETSAITISKSINPASSNCNEVTGLCEESSNGGLIVDLKLNNATNLDDLINSTANFSYIIAIKQVSTGLIYSSAFSNFNYITEAEFLDGLENNLTTNLLTQPVVGGPNGLTLIQPVSAGDYQITAYFYDIAYNAVANPINGLNYCKVATSNASVGVQDCECEQVVHGCTDPTALNYNFNCSGNAVQATVDDGCCEYPYNCEDDGLCDCQCLDGTYAQECCPPDPICGCADPTATNYNPAGNYYDPAECPCEYDGDNDDDPPVVTSINACIPPRIDHLIQYTDDCIAKAGHRFYTKHITGLGNSCSNMETMKMVIINDLLNRKGLPCIFNCSDNDTPKLEVATNDCAANWENNGSLVWNPVDANAGNYSIGVHVRRPPIPNPNNLPGPIYVAISNQNLDVDPASNNPNSAWRRCLTKTIKLEDNNYLPNFLKFAYEYCKDCGIAPYRDTEVSSSVVIDRFTIGGTVPSIGGQPLTNSEDESELT